MEDNKLIAEFMDVNLITIDDIRANKNPYISSVDGYTKEDLQYHTSWNWLMPVVDKIEEMGFTTSIKTSYVRINPREMGRYDNYISWISFSKGSWHSRNPCPSVDDDVDNGYESIGHETINKRQAIYKAVVSFINWYNKNK